MNRYRKELWLKIPQRRGFINITPQVEECLRENRIWEGKSMNMEVYNPIALEFGGDP